MRQLAGSSSVTLRWRVTLLAASVVAVAVALAAIAAYAMVSRALYADVDKQLQARATGMIDSDLDALDFRFVLTLGSLYSSDVSIALQYPGTDEWVALPREVRVPIGEVESAVARGAAEFSLRTSDNRRVLAQRMKTGTTLVIWQSLRPTQGILDRLALLMFVIGGSGVVLAAAAGAAVGRTGLRPVARLTSATERIARTGELKPIPVTGDDELGRLTESFNTMLLALAESRARQRRLVADAGHELRTPLTSLRTNMELLIASYRPDAPAIPEEDMVELRTDVLAQIEEMATLVSDLVDLAREDVAAEAYEQVDISEVAERALERARRRRTGITFVADLRPWFLYGHEADMERAILNVLDNAAKWSPEGAEVAVSMHETGTGLMELAVHDAGPGIPPDERELVFERFYRSTAARSMPGSGLGLAIVKQVVARHGGTITVETSDRGGALMRVMLPGTNVLPENACQPT
ncbi:HAMP domain-containing sensor histidine kinase [Nocardia sp. NPDC051756]|uniref:HAMP domain-containing sensor histidine kinase n=1 Tax=Nocardia sp. NPDC051756 TaxID=3154751 RepID=UPI0034246785